MEKKDSFEKKIEKFIAGRGYYIVLTLCVVVIGVSAYFLLADMGSSGDDNQFGSELSGGYVDGPVIAVPPEIMPEQFDEPVFEEPENPVLDALTETAETGVLNEPKEPAISAQFIWPVFGEISLPYSVNTLVYNQKMGDWRTHDGIDLAASLGTQVLATNSGRVVSVRTDDLGGMSVVIEHAGGLQSHYSNLAAVATVYEGDNVNTGEVIGAIGATALGERAESPKLCFKMTLDGQSVNPADYLPIR